MGVRHELEYDSANGGDYYVHLIYYKKMKDIWYLRTSPTKNSDASS